METTLDSKKMALTQVSNYACKHFGQQTEHLERMIHYINFFWTCILFVVVLNKV